MDSAEPEADVLAKQVFFQLKSSKEDNLTEKLCKQARRRSSRSQEHKETLMNI
jgi:hypothetical protein